MWLSLKYADTLKPYRLRVERIESYWPVLQREVDGDAVVRTMSGKEVTVNESIELIAKGIQEAERLTAQSQSF